MKIIDCEKIQKDHSAVLKNKINKLPKPLKVVGIYCGEDSAALSFLKVKERKATELNIAYEIRNIPYNTEFEQSCLNTIKILNKDENVDGIWLQLPLPKASNAYKILSTFDCQKDIDGLNPDGLGKIVLGQKTTLQATVRAVITIINSVKVSINGLRVLIIGVSPWLGMPLALELSLLGATIIQARSKEQNLESIVSFADIVISCAGVPGLIKATWLKTGALGIDVGFSKVDGKIRGDFDLEGAENKNITVTPVPGGVGPLTVVSLYENLYDLVTL